LTKKVTTPKFLNIARYAAHAGVTRQSISQMIDRGQLKVARRKGREKLLNVREADLAREQNRLRDSTTPSVLTARMGQIGSELALKLERLSRVKASLTFSAAAGVGARVLADVLLPRLTVDDQLVDLVLEAGDASRTRAALIVWTRNVLQAAVVGLEARAREYAEEAPRLWLRLQSVMTLALR
jgi:hypothetical protein